MRRTNTRCSACGNFLSDYSGMGEEPALICQNGNCPSRIGNIVCPNCGSTKKGVLLAGIGTQLYRCRACNNEYEA
jgi:predicted nucleic acid-binding Zn ribbon protein